ncbi:hypothetical protein JZ751_023122 [Albula glossodonta]|uniref:BTB/POZ domain-containing protein KCTD7 n=1 Tax=Albula glossodonta TaxID=121402 RepID=A0A8T2PKU5_9TELE|nr:hypothetical protein JZ751_023122 [Albula glossodonta]
MQQYGSGEASNGERPLSCNTSSPVPAPASRVRRFAQERRAVPQPRVMVVFSAQTETDKPGDVMSSSDSAEDDFRKPAIPVPNLNLGKSLRTLNASQEVIPLNVGGTYYTTRLSTLRRYEDTMLAAMFSGRHHIPRDAEGRFFIDRDGAYFGLEDTQPLTGEKVRQAFLDLLPYYKENLERIVEIAKLRAMQRKARFAKLKICVYKEEMPITPYERPLFNSLRFERSESEAKLFEHHCEVDVSFGPWEAVADVYDLLHCIVSDLAERGITADQQCIGVCDKHLINHYYCKRPIYEFKITWW